MSEYTWHGSQDEETREMLQRMLDKGNIRGVDMDIVSGCAPIFADDTEHPTANPGPRAEWVAVDFCTPPEDFRRLTAEVHLRKREGYGVDDGRIMDDIRSDFGMGRESMYDEVFDDRLIPSALEDVREGIGDSDNPVPKPYIELDDDYSLKNQEGRHRTAVAIEKGYTYINVRLLSPAPRDY